LDCDFSYEVRYGVRGAAIGVAPYTIQSISWGRRNDEISKAKIVHTLNDPDCCSLLGDIEPLADNLEILLDNNIVWSGPITAVEYGRSTVVVEAEDMLSWARRRVLQQPYEKKQDEAIHFKELWDNAMQYSPIPVEIITSATGVIASRRYPNTQKRIVWFILKELMDAAVDVTVIGNQMYVGTLAFGERLTLGSDDFSGDIVLRKAGELFANQVIVEGARSVVGQYPPGIVSGSEIYPLVQDLVFDESINSNATAAATARSRYDFTSGVVPRVVRAGDALTLRQGAIDVKELIPGRIVSLEFENLCYAQTQDFRLGSVDVDVAAGVQTIGISLQPIGTLAQVEGITADDDSGGFIDTEEEA
jgi:hypothetical protein